MIVGSYQLKIDDISDALGDKPVAILQQIISILNSKPNTISIKYRQYLTWSFGLLTHQGHTEFSNGGYINAPLSNAELTFVTTINWYQGGNGDTHSIDQHQYWR